MWCDYAKLFARLFPVILTETSCITLICNTESSEKTRTLPRPSQGLNPEQRLQQALLTLTALEVSVGPDMEQVLIKHLSNASVDTLALRSR